MANRPAATLPISNFGWCTGRNGLDLTIVTNTDSKTIKLNAKDYTQATGDSIAFQTVPNQTVTTTGEVFGGQIKPRIANTISAATCNGLGVDSELKGTGATTVTGDLRIFNTYLGAAAAAHVIGGDAVGWRARQEISTNPTGDITLMKVLNNEGSQGWDAFVKFVSSGDGAIALGSHSMTTSSDKTGNAKSGTIKVKANDTLYHIQLYAD